MAKYLNVQGAPYVLDNSIVKASWRDYMSWLAWERLRILPEEQVEVAGERSAWAS